MQAIEEVYTHTWACSSAWTNRRTSFILDLPATWHPTMSFRGWDSLQNHQLIYRFALMLLEIMPLFIVPLQPHCFKCSSWHKILSIPIACIIIPFNIFPWMSSESGTNQLNRKLYINQRGITTDSNKKHVSFPHRYLPRRSILQTTSHSPWCQGEGIQLGADSSSVPLLLHGDAMNEREHRKRSCRHHQLPRRRRQSDGLQRGGSNVYKRKTVNLYYLLFPRCYMVQCNLNIRRYLLCCFFLPYWHYMSFI